MLKKAKYQSYQETKTKIHKGTFPKYVSVKGFVSYYVLDINTMCCED